MSWHEARLRWRALWKRREFDRDLEDEIRFHLEMRAQRKRENGLSEADAQISALKAFGNTTRWKEDIREMWQWTFVESVMQDVRYAFRSLSKTPGFTLAVVSVLALGIGSTTSIFSVVNAALLRPLPFPEPDRLVLLWGNVQRQTVERRGNSYPDYLDWKAQGTSFARMAAYEGISVTWAGPEQAERLPAERVSAGYFEILGVKPIAGRTIREDEDRPGASNPVVLMSERLWRTRFGGDAQMLGRPLTLNQRQLIVIAILPEWFRGLTDTADVWVPYAGLSTAADLAQRGNRDFPAVARLKDGVTLAQAQPEMDVISKRLEKAYPGTNDRRGVEVAPLENELLGTLRRPLNVLLGAVGFVLLIACANVASLLLARGEARKQEIAVRTALGAGQARLFRQLITESVVLAGTGTLLGLVLAFWAVRLLARFAPITLPSFVQPQLDWTVALFAIALSVSVGVVVGFAPAMQAKELDLHSVTREAHTTETLPTQRLRSVLVVSEVAVAAVLLISAGLLMQSWLHLTKLHPGFDPSGVLTLQLSLPRVAPAAMGESTPDARSVATARQLLERVRALPSVVAASVSSDYPMGGNSNAIFFSAEGQDIADAQTRPRAYIHRVSPGFFEALQISFVAGRRFQDADLEGPVRGVIVTESLVQRFWPGQDPIRKRIKAGALESQNPWWSIIGVVRDLKFRGVPNNPTADPDIFLPFSDRQREIGILVRTSMDPASLATSIRNVVREFDPSIPVYEVSTLSERLSRAIERERFSSWLMGVFAALALTLAGVGLYGLMAYTVRRRTREFGIRIALGATVGEVTSMVVRKGMGLVAAGIAAGVVLAVVTSNVLSALLFGVRSRDATTFLVVAVVLGAVSLAACYLPARRASRTDPVTALRYE
ncbi:MAG TPA: ABC transporter permease [Bryobacteraceae bacterium]|nr:ABC transporter permease [Bryobacteraceae bacterium]